MLGLAERQSDFRGEAFELFSLAFAEGESDEGDKYELREDVANWSS